ncbi:hypothetical protein Acy02nite_85210 [Actinoplanes cyaneus]|uniref:DUF4350 domain-containing protein n=1 Tax=Actinoplanes cyaneus TaxID=52696 RepID=A0A919M5N4_9ACTN|nr:DUF4350 domain-containing protein [Actinoplanes cyaneus]MCW2143860.1 hypothetical protein [Actinoplanes cyaneus]GID70640.1 hypothetical protein Acy02nite_85210 [Actinoplanes cyaneus]
MTTAVKVRRSRRWLRVAIPFAVLFAVITGTLVVHAIERPDQDDAAYLSPVSQDGIGSAVLAGELRERGVTVIRETSSETALSAMRGGAATLLVTTPELADLDQLTAPGALPAGTRIVVVGPDPSAIARTNWPVEVTRERWATGLVAPACTDPIAHAAGTAAVGGRWYGTSGAATCYDGAVLSLGWGGSTVTMVGAPDPFRNDRITEHGNRALAVGLLSQNPRVVWLDVHHREVQPQVSPSPTTETAEPRTTRPTREPRESSTGQPRDDPARGEQPQSQSEPDPLAEAFPPAVWASVALLAIALLAVAIAAARRLGTPVAEPLPSRVPSNETMLGHARLYQRAHARDESLGILRAAAQRRLVAHLGLPPGATIADIAEAAGYEVADVQEILADFLPENDAELVSAANAVQNLVREITGFEGDQS